MPNALILGASRGLGLGLARELVNRGWQVTGTVRKAADQAGLEAVGAGSAIADITDPASLSALQTGNLDLLFVNAGIAEPNDLESIDLDGIGHLFMTNAVAPVRAAVSLLGALKPHGMLAFMSSRMGSVSLTTQDNRAMYRASKAALNSLTRAKIASFGERPVLTFHPGWVETDMGGKGADLDVATSVKGIVNVIEENRNAPGSVFVDYSGATLAW